MKNKTVFKLSQNKAEKKPAGSRHKLNEASYVSIKIIFEINFIMNDKIFLKKFVYWKQKKVYFS